MHSELPPSKHTLPPEIAIPLSINQLSINETIPPLPESIDIAMLRSTVTTQAQNIGALIGDLEHANNRIEKLEADKRKLKELLKQKEQVIKNYRRLVKVLRADNPLTQFRDAYLGVLFSPVVRYISDRWLEKKMSEEEHKNLEKQ